MIYSQDRWWLTNSVTRFEEMSSLWQNFRSLWQVLIFKSIYQSVQYDLTIFYIGQFVFVTLLAAITTTAQMGDNFLIMNNFGHTFYQIISHRRRRRRWSRSFVRYFWIDFFAWECFSLNLSIGNNWRYGISCFQTSKCCFSFCCCCFETKFSQKNQFLKNLPLTLDVVTTWSNNCLQLLKCS